jgi:ribonuclease R
MNLKNKKISAKELQLAIVQFLAAHPRKQYNAKQIREKIRVDNSRDSVQDALNRLMIDGSISTFKDAKYSISEGTPQPIPEEKTVSENITPKTETPREFPVKSFRKESFEEKNPRSERKIVTGTLDMTRNGTAYIVTPDNEEDVFVGIKNIKNALHGDTVRAQMWYPKGRKKPDGEVMEVLERAAEHFLGTIRFSKRYAIVIPDRQNMPVDIYVDLEDTNNAKEGDKVVVKITKWHGKLVKSPIAIVTSVLGKSGSNDLEMKSILINAGFNIDFPEEVIEESNLIAEKITDEEVAKRRDMRTTCTFTIDPFDAKDFDDALSFKELENGNYEIGIHIADVSHYILPNTQLDKEAFRRSTSVYLADRVCPMLPEKLSNELCSLRPHEDKLTFSAVFEMTKTGTIVTSWFGRTVTHSDRRFTYEEAQEIIEGKEGELSHEVLTVNKLSQALRKKRFKNGAIDFDSEEIRFKLDENAVPVDVYIKERKDSNMLIEEFMLLANREVATFVAKKEKPEIPMIYRIHDLPNTDKLQEFAQFAAGMGLKFDFSTPKQIAESFNQIVKAAAENVEYKILAPLAIRTMAKAAYSSANIGHYGLAFDHYSHFTSPIRRYSDVIAHRILAENLDGKTRRFDKTKLEEACNHISKQERKAMEAERESTKYKQTEYMKTRLGEVFEGQVSGMLDRGIFVETTYAKCEGLIGFDKMSEGFELTNGRLIAKGRRTGKIFKLGDTVKIRVISVDMAKRQIEMELA